MSLEGKGKPLYVVFKYLSPEPLTYTLLPLSCLETPEILFTAPAASPIPLRESSLAPILSFTILASF